MQVSEIGYNELGILNVFLEAAQFTVSLSAHKCLISSHSINMRNTVLLTVSGLAASSAASILTSAHDCNKTSSPATTCNYLKQYYPNMTILPSDSKYTAENEGKPILRPSPVTLSSFYQYHGMLETGLGPPVFPSHPMPSNCRALSRT